jgi:hypothetical protein
MDKTICPIKLKEYIFYISISMTITIKYNQIGTYAKECESLYAEQRRLFMIYNRKTEGLTTIISKDAKIFTEKMEEIHKKLSKFNVGSNMVIGTYKIFDEKTTLSEFLSYFPGNNSICFLKDNKERFMDWSRFVNIISNSNRTLKELGYQEGDIVYIHVNGNVNTDKIKEMLEEKYDYTFFQDKDKLIDTVPKQNASGLDSLVASNTTKNVGNKTHINRKRKNGIKQEKKRRELKEKGYKNIKLKI